VVGWEREGRGKGWKGDGGRGNTGEREGMGEEWSVSGRDERQTHTKKWPTTSPSSTTTSSLVHLICMWVRVNFGECVHACMYVRMDACMHGGFTKCKSHQNTVRWKWHRLADQNRVYKSGLVRDQISEKCQTTTYSARGDGRVRERRVSERREVVVDATRGCCTRCAASVLVDREVYNFYLIVCTCTARQNGIRTVLHPTRKHA